MLDDRLTLTIHSCQKFSDLWDSHIYLLNKNWHNRKIRTLIVTDEQNNKVYENVELISTGTGKEMSDRMKEALKIIDTKYVLVTLDDYFPIYKIDNEKIERLIDIMEKEDIDYMRLFHRPKSNHKFKNYKNIYKIDLYEDQYAVNLYAGIWKKSFLEKTIRKTLNAWQYEVSLTNIAKEINANCVMSKGKEFEILDVIRKGKILTKANKYLKNNNLKIGNREVMKKKDEFIIEFRTILKRILPKKVVVKIKKYLKNKGYKFYSE